MKNMVPNSIVAIPASNRVELLALTLEKLDAARNRPEVHIYADSVPESRLVEIEAIRDIFLPDAFLFHAKPHPVVPSGCWNILNAIKSAAKFAEKVYLLESDVLIYPTFFEFHEAQTAPASCGRRHPDLRWQYRDLYCNPGSCLRRPLLDALVPHINSEYFQDTKAYCDKHFPPWEVSTLDDWLIRRVMKQEGMSCVYPETPMCAHVGFRGYGSLDIYQNNEVDLGKRIERARYLLATVSNKDMYAKDFEPYAP